MDYLLAKFINYEDGGAFAMLQKTWRKCVTDKDIALVVSSVARARLSKKYVSKNVNADHESWRSLSKQFRGIEVGNQ